MEEVMFRNLAFVVICAVLLPFTRSSVLAVNTALKRKPRPCLKEQWPQ